MRTRATEPMTNRAPFKLLLLVVVVCFALGLLSVFLRQAQQSSGALTPTATVVASNGQTTLLILGVNVFSGADPKLNSIWLATYRLPGKDVFLYGVPINQPVAVGGASGLQALFHWSAEQGVDPTFLSKLQEIVPLPPQVVIVMDDAAFAAIVDYLGGVELNGTSFSGNQVLGVLSLVGDDPQALLASQSHLLEALVQKLPALGETPDVSSIQALVPEHIHLSIPVSQLLGSVAPLLPVEPASIYVSLWSKPSQP